MTLKDLLQLAKNQLRELSSLENPDFRLEQAVFKEEENQWDIVVSYLVENTNKKVSPFSSITSEFQYLRIYKKMLIGPNSEVIGFFIYNRKDSAS